MVAAPSRLPVQRGRGQAGARCLAGLPSGISNGCDGAMIDDASLQGLLSDLEEQRCQVMIDCDQALLERVLHDDLIWIHASGRIDRKATLISMLKRDQPYKGLSISDHSLRKVGNACISTGTIEITLRVSDAPPPYFNLFTNIWVLNGPQFALVHGQSTRCPPPTPEFQERIRR
jgi:hypothetical protein